MKSANKLKLRANESSKCRTTDRNVSCDAQMAPLKQSSETTMKHPAKSVIVPSGNAICDRRDASNVHRASTFPANDSKEISPGKTTVKKLTCMICGESDHDEENCKYLSGRLDPKVATNLGKVLQFRKANEFVIDWLNTSAQERFNDGE